jgi:aquaporin Z
MSKIASDTTWVKSMARTIAFADNTTRTRHPAIEAMKSHWWVYLAEAALLALFMISACAFAVLFEYPNSPVHQAIPNPFMRRGLMGLAMGLTVVALIYSPWGKRSGAHMNPAITLCFLRLGKIDAWDATYYIVAQFIGAAAAIGFSRLVAKPLMTHPAINYIVTVPGGPGTIAAWIGEFGISFFLMRMILSFNRFPRLITRTGVFAGVLVAIYITLEAPLSGASTNPARTLGSAMFAELFTGLWVYFTAPVLGMLAAVEISRLLAANPDRLCAKLTHSYKTPCILRCNCMDVLGVERRRPKAPLAKDAARYPLLDAVDVAALGPGMSEYLVNRIRTTRNIVVREGVEIPESS